MLIRSLLVICAIAGLVAGGLSARPALAASCGGCACVNLQHTITRNLIKTQYEQTRRFITDEFKKNQRWVLEDFFTGEVAPATKMMTEQLVTNGMNQMLALGTMIDAKHQLETQQLFQRRAADAHKDYQPATDVCVWGTATMHLAPAYSRAGLTTHVLTQRSLDRQLGNKSSTASLGPDSDRTGRVAAVRTLYCNPGDNFQATQFMCNAGGPGDRRDNDLNYGRVMGQSLTLRLNFSDAELTADEQDVIALQNYLYAHNVFTRVPLPVIATREGQEGWLNMRSVIAKRGVAENSFSNIIGMKSWSPDEAMETAEYLSVVFRRMGISDADARAIVGTRPSYAAMMQILSQSIYQTPSFFVNLYDKPVNVKRKGVGMQAINLMLDRDTYLSELRSEAVLSQLLEVEVVKAQGALENAAGRLTRRGRTN